MASPTNNTVPTSSTAYPGDSQISALMSGFKWGGGPGSGVTLTYSFPAASASFLNPYSNLDEPGFNHPGYYSPTTGAQQAAFEGALAAWANVANVKFQEVPDNQTTVGEIRVAWSLAVTGFSAYSYYPSDHPSGGDIWLNPTDPGMNGALAVGGFPYYNLIHELGHVLGLKHPFEQGNSGTTLPGNLDNSLNTVMSYTYDPTGHGYISGRYPETPMLLDIKAIQHLYGANTSYHAGNSTYAFAGDGEYYRTLWDAGGTDLIDYRGAGAGARIDLGEGHWSSIGKPILLYDINGFVRDTEIRTVWIAYGARIENAYGGNGGDTLIGNGLANLLSGYDGADSISGLSGNDRINGGEGDDLLDGGAGNDRIAGGGGSDTLYGREGTDKLIGGGGDDRYFINSGNELDKTLTDNGVDTVNATFSYQLGSAQENLVLLGTGDFNGKGNAGNNEVTGNAGVNALSGNSGDDVLGGGKGADILKGGNGADSLTGGNGRDVFVFNKALEVTNIDTITDFVPGVDRIKLDDDIFLGLAGPVGATLPFDQFQDFVSASFDPSSVRIHYDTVTGALYYDADGSGTFLVQFAVLAGAPTISADDFLIAG